MSSEPGNHPSPDADIGESFTFRAFSVGSALVLLLAVVCPYTVFLHQTAGMFPCLPALILAH